MKIQVREIKKGDIFTESGITNVVVDLTYNNYVNGTEIVIITTEALKYNKKYFGDMKPTKGGFGYYTKKLTTSISVQR